MTVQLQDSVLTRGSVERNQRQPGKGHTDSSFVDQLKETAEEKAGAGREVEGEELSGHAIDAVDDGDRASGGRDSNSPQVAKQNVDLLDAHVRNVATDNVQTFGALLDAGAETHVPPAPSAIEQKLSVAPVASSEVRAVAVPSAQTGRPSVFPLLRADVPDAASRSQDSRENQIVVPSRQSRGVVTMSEGVQTRASVELAATGPLAQPVASGKAGAENLRTLERILGGGQQSAVDVASRALVRGTPVHSTDGKDVVTSRTVDQAKVQINPGSAAALETGAVARTAPASLEEQADADGAKIENTRGVHQVAVASRETHVLLPTLGVITGQLGSAIVADLAQAKTSAPPVPTPDAASNLPNANSVLRSIKLQLQPAELGLITVKMSLRENVLQLEVQADEIATARTLGQGRDALSSLLQGSGYVVDDIVVRGVDAVRGVDMPSLADRTGADVSGKGGQADGQRASDNNGRSSREQDGRSDREQSSGSDEAGREQHHQTSDRALYL